MDILCDGNLHIAVTWHCVGFSSLNSLNLLRACLQVANLYGFSSLKKMASVLVRTEDGYRLYNKASVIVAPHHTVTDIAEPHTDILPTMRSRYI